MEKVEAHKHWWLGENKQWHREEEVLIRLAFPRCIIRYKVKDGMFAEYDQWVNKVINLQWLDNEKPSKQEENEILSEAWNFLAIEEQLLEEDMIDIEIDEGLEYGDMQE